jgi:carboxypeptidase Q
MNRAKVATAIALLFSTLLAVAQTQHAPSTPAERDRLVKLAAKLQSDPLDPALDADRSWAMKWIDEIPDITVNLCDPIYATMKDAPHGNLLAQIMTISSTAYIIQHPDKADLDVLVNQAGMTGMLKAYQAIVANAPRQRSAGLDDLVAKMKAGTLEKYVSDETMKCSTGPRS